MIRNPALAQLANLSIPSSLTFEGLPIPGLGGSGLLLLVAGLAVTGVARVRTLA